MLEQFLREIVDICESRGPKQGMALGLNGSIDIDVDFALYFAAKPSVDQIKMFNARLDKAVKGFMAEVHAIALGEFGPAVFTSEQLEAAITAARAHLGLPPLQEDDDGTDEEVNVDEPKPGFGFPDGPGVSGSGAGC
mgnify:CR=1 FL=1